MGFADPTVDTVGGDDQVTVGNLVERRDLALELELGRKLG